MANLLCKLALLLIVLAFPIGAQAGHEEVPFLEDAILVGQGVCRVTEGERVFAIPCEQYVKPDGSRYVAMYLGGRIAVVRKLADDGSVGEVVWSSDQQPVKPTSAGQEV